MFDHQRSFAVVTGGSNGIGFELTRQFLANGFDVLIAAQDEARPREAASRLSADGGTVTCWAGDLGREDQVDALHAAIRATERPVDALCVNAGFGLGGPFVETDLQRELWIIDLSVRGAVQLTKLVPKDVVARNARRIMFTSSSAVTMPDPFEAVYGGTKVFLRWFGEALHEALKDTGVSVTVLMPSMTETNSFKHAEMMDTKAGTTDKDDPGVVSKTEIEPLSTASFISGGDHPDDVVATLQRHHRGSIEIVEEVQLVEHRLKRVVGVGLFLIQIDTEIDLKVRLPDPDGHDAMRGIADFRGPAQQDRRILVRAFFHQLGGPTRLRKADRHGAS